ncbi:ABC transporter C family member [Trifolium repens]|nr:ABC transporter C family member [Trifolium repens]
MMNFWILLLEEENIVDVVSLPMLLVLCFNALPNVCVKEQSEIEQRLLQKEFESSTLGDESEEAFVKASLWSKLTFRWLNPIFEMGRIQKLEHVHVPSVPQSETAASASSMLEESIRKQKLQGGSLTKAIVHSVWKSLALNAVLAGVNTIASYIGPLLISNFVNFLLSNDDNSNIKYGMILAFIFFLSKTVESLSQRQWYFGAQRIGIQVRAALMALVYSKSLTIKCGGPTHGKIINLINVDVERIGDFCWYVHGVWLLPVQIILALAILYINLGYTPSIAALVVTILVMVCNTPLANMQEGLHSKIMEAKDSRIKMTSETMKNIRILKLHSWESTFLQKLFQLRDTERKWLHKYLYLCSAVATLFWASPTLVSVFTFGACILVKTELTAATVLSALATFRILQEPIYNLPELISMITQTKVSVDRIQDFIKEEDQNQFINKHASKTSIIAIEIKPGEYAWEENDQYLKKPTIHIAEKLSINKDIYFLDDPFSAVDAHTGSHLFKECLMKLLYDKTVVYATHQLEFLEAADLILVMKDGKIVESGRYKDLIACPNSEFVQQMSAHEETICQIPCRKDDSVCCRPCQKNPIEIAEENIQEIMMDWKRTREEEAMTGRVKWSVYSTFVTLAYKGALVPVILLCQVLFQVMQMGSNYWMSWATEKKGRVDNVRLMGIFALLSGGSSVFILGRTVLMATVAVETAQRLFHGMITSVFRAPVSFFDTTPSSRILSRSSTDQSTVDTDIPYRLAGLVFALIQLLSIIVLMSQAAWQVILLFFVVLAISVWYQAYYITTARELARMVGIRKAPILHHFSESIAGAATIRCFNQEKIFLTKVMVLIDDYSRVAFHNFATMEWLSVRINFLFNLVFYFVLIILVSLPRSAIDPSLAGLVATYGLNLNVLQAWDPTLFLGTVRTNLDPLEQHTDQELWEVLSKCHLAEIVQQDPRLLDAPVAENGENWSVGQRQLVCLARLLLKKRKILVLDEATASIDTATDNLIQKTIREETSGCTVITVAHRIPTVIDNDLVLVLNEGTIAEYDKPSQLLQDSSSSFSKLVSEFLRRSSQTQEFLTHYINSLKMKVPDHSIFIPRRTILMATVVVETTQPSSFSWMIITSSVKLALSDFLLQ